MPFMVDSAIFLLIYLFGLFMKKNIKKIDVTVLIPAINEEESLYEIIQDCQKITEYSITVLVIIDSKATSGTRKTANNSKATVIDIGKGRGKGKAIQQAIPYIKTEYTIQIDADYQFIPNEIPKLLQYLDSGYDVVLGTRYEKGAHVENGS